MDKFSIQNIQRINSLTSELEYEKASSLYLKLRVLVKEDKSYEPIRTHLRGLIKDYEQNKWADEDKITDIKDILISKKTIIGIESNITHIKRSDVNKNGILDIKDTQTIKKAKDL